MKIITLNGNHVEIQTPEDYATVNDNFTSASEYVKQIESAIILNEVSNIEFIGFMSIDWKRRQTPVIFKLGNDYFFYSSIMNFLNKLKTRKFTPTDAMRIELKLNNSKYINFSDTYHTMCGVDYKLEDNFDWTELNIGTTGQLPHTYQRKLSYELESVGLEFIGFDVKWENVHGSIIFVDGNVIRKYPQTDLMKKIKSKKIIFSDCTIVGMISSGYIEQEIIHEGTLFECKKYTSDITTRFGGGRAKTPFEYQTAVCEKLDQLKKTFVGFPLHTKWIGQNTYFYYKDGDDLCKSTLKKFLGSDELNINPQIENYYIPCIHVHHGMEYINFDCAKKIKIDPRSLPPIEIQKTLETLGNKHNIKLVGVEYPYRGYLSTIYYEYDGEIFHFNSLERAKIYLGRAYFNPNENTKGYSYKKESHFYIHACGDAMQDGITNRDVKIRLREENNSFMKKYNKKWENIFDMYIMAGKGELTKKLEDMRKEIYEGRFIDGIDGSTETYSVIYEEQLLEVLKKFYNEHKKYCKVLVDVYGYLK